MTWQEGEGKAHDERGDASRHAKKEGRAWEMPGLPERGSGGAPYSAATAFLSPWNCSVSVEPAIAVVEDLPAEMATATASK
jgi:hypothetical protein